MVIFEIFVVFFVATPDHAVVFLGMAKLKTSLAIDPEIHAKLGEAATSYGASRSKIAETAIAFFLSQPEATRICAVTNQLGLGDSDDENA